jgi:hypothetical protein
MYVSTPYRYYAEYAELLYIIVCIIVFAPQNVYLEYHRVCLHVRIETPHPLSRGPPRLRVREWVPIRTIGEKAYSTLSTLWFAPRLRAALAWQLRVTRSHLFL